uniref:Cytochrome P450 71A1 n=1 Tax=Aegilops tauschii subsp. strangulata TaxID=200361 RepID=A0A452YJW7_AEGTS
FVLTTLAFLLFTLLVSKTRSKVAARRTLPPSPPSLPVFGHLRLLGSLPHRSLRSLAASYGPVMYLRLGRVPTVVACSAAAAEEAMKTRDLAFASRPKLFMEVAALVDRVRRAGTVVNLSDNLIVYSFTAISRATFGDADYGIDGEEGGARLRKVFAEIEELLGTVPMGEKVPWLRWVDVVTGLERKARRAFEEMDGLLERVITDHRQRRGAGDGDQRDFVDVLLAAKELDTNGIKAIILDMLAAATDSTFTLLEWAMAELINHPQEMRKLQDEVRTAVGDAGHVTEDHLPDLRYLKAVVKETLRLHPPTPLLLPRETVEDTQLLGYHVPAGTRVLGQDFAFLPFGAGRRGCPGVRFAMPSNELALASLVYHFDWELAGGRKPPVDMTELHGLSVRLKTPLLLVAKPWSGRGVE